MKAHELYSAVDPAVVTEILDWFRANDRNVYKSAVATLAANRKLRPVFVQKKTLPDQYAWILKTLKLNACDTIGEHRSTPGPVRASRVDVVRIEPDHPVSLPAPP